MFDVLLKVGLLSVFCAIFTTHVIFAQDRADASVYVADVDPDTAYCFSFTWLGPKFDNTSMSNLTCKALGVAPCQEPLVITLDSTPPNTTFMWLNYDINQFACRLTKGEVCTKWVTYYGGQVNNITYMCSKYTVDGEPKTNWEGCEIDVSQSTDVEACACRSTPGEEPCNAATRHTSLATLLIVLCAAVLALRAVV